MNTPRTFSARLPFFALAISLILVGPACQNEDAALREEVTEEIGGELDTSLTQIMDQPDEPRVQAGIPVAVVIDENTIGIEPEVEPGPTVLTIRNSGLNEHSLAIEGPGGSWRLESALAPGDVGNLEVEFQPGTYRVWDPRNETLATEITVRTAGSETD